MSGGSGAWAGALAALLLECCSAPLTLRANPGAYDRVPSTWSEDLAAARLAFERGDAHSAYSRVAPLALQQPNIVPARTFLQDIELALLESEGKVGNLVASSSAEARAVLERWYEDQAEGHALAEGYVLAARIAGTGEAALALLDEADTIDPRCVWVHYGRAWWCYTMRRFKEARESLRIALRLDGGHLPSLRLHATMLAGAGEYDDAAEVLEVWLERTADNSLFAAADRADGLLDLAALDVMLDEPKAALERLEELDPRAVRDPARAEEVRAAAYESRGEVARALEAVTRARSLRASVLLPLVQRAIVLQNAGDPDGEKKTWLELLELSEKLDAAPESTEELSSIDFEAALFRLQAHTRLARLEREAREP